MSNKMLNTALLGFIFSLALPAQEASVTTRWTLQQCIDYALANNVTLLKNRTNEQSYAIDVVEAKAGLLPSLNGSVSQSLTYRPFQDAGSSFVNGGIATSAADKATQSGTYGVNASWVVWNGGKKKMNITNAEYNQELASYDTEKSANSIKEQIAQYYVQILYMQEAEHVNSLLLEQDSILCSRGQTMVDNGKMAKAELAQLQSQVSQGKYDLVNIRTQIADAKLQLKQLLELPATENFDIISFSATDEQVLALIPSKTNIYEAALNTRPEIKRSQLAIEQSQLSTKIAKAGYYPTISLSGGLGDSHMTGAQNNFFNQMKNNFNASLGVSVSIPIFDNRQTKSAVERAKVAETTAQLDLQDTQKQLYQTIETYWLNATNSQAKYIAARDNVSSMQTSYELMSEQFKVGLKNIAELLTSRANLLSAEQSMLQDKYTALLNRHLLSFYADNDLSDLTK